MEKRLFQILDEMNVEDCEKGTELVMTSGHFVSAQKTKQGGTITMGVEERCILDLLGDSKYMPILLLVKREEYKKRDT